MKCPDDLIHWVEPIVKSFDAMRYSSAFGMTEWEISLRYENWIGKLLANKKSLPLEVEDYPS